MNMLMVCALLQAALVVLAGGSAFAAGSPGVEELPKMRSVAQYGITWTFDQEVPVGQFVTGDHYVVGRVTVQSVDPAPVGSGNEFRNGSMLNPPTDRSSAYDGRIRGFQEELAARLPLQMKPGDSLVSTISLEQQQQNQVLANPTRRAETSWLRTAAVLTCLASPVRADAFRPGYCDLEKDRIHRAGELRWDLLPSVKRTQSTPPLGRWERVFERPWLDHVYDWSSRTVHPSENIPGYGREVARAVSIGALLLCCDFTREEKEKLTIGLVQVGIDNWSVAERSKHRESGGWPAAGGFGNGRKWPIVFAGMMLGDEEMLNINEHAPEACFGEDQHTAFGKCWTGARVLFTGQYPMIGDRQIDRGPYEHLHPSEWPGERKTMSEGYRRCCTSVSWIGQALAARLMNAERAWDHDAFFVYCDRWMNEDDAPFVKIINEVYPERNFRPQQGRTWDAFVDEMWKAYRGEVDESSWKLTGE